MELINIKLEIKLNEYLYEKGEITKNEYEIARSALINRLTLFGRDDKINNINTNLNQEMMKMKNEIT